MKLILKIYEVEFVGIQPVGNCLILAAYSITQAKKIASETITHTTNFIVKKVTLDNPKVIVYLSGDY